MAYSLTFPMAAHVAHAGLLYVFLTMARAPSVWGIGTRPDGSNPWAGIEPRISANLSNQFEWPLFFHSACLVLLFQRESGHCVLALAWIFVGGRLLHSYVQIAGTSIRLRGVVFMVNFIAVLGLWTVVLLNASKSS